MKLSTIYNLPSLEVFVDSASQPGFTDAEGGVILGRMLTVVDPKIFEQVWPELSFMNAGINVDNTGGYARKIQSLQIRIQGTFTNSHDADDDKGKISLAGDDSYMTVTEWQAHSKWTDSQIKEADLAGINLPQRLIQAHNIVYQRSIDDNVAAVLLDTGTWGDADSTDYSAMKGSALYEAFAGAISEQWGSVNNIPQFRANRVITSPSTYNKLARSVMPSSLEGHVSVLKALEANFGGVVFSASHKAKNAGAGGTKDAAVIFNNGGDSMKLRIPVPLTVGEVVKLNSFDFQVDSKYRFAGLDVLETKAGYLMTKV